MDRKQQERFLSRGTAGLALMLALSAVFGRRAGPDLDGPDHADIFI
jgi:hypothetical protein